MKGKNGKSLWKIEVMGESSINQPFSRTRYDVMFDDQRVWGMEPLKCVERWELIEPWWAMNIGRIIDQYHQNHGGHGGQMAKMIAIQWQRFWRSWLMFVGLVTGRQEPAQDYWLATGLLSQTVITINNPWFRNFARCWDDICLGGIPLAREQWPCDLMKFWG